MSRLPLGYRAKTKIGEPGEPGSAVWGRERKKERKKGSLWTFFECPRLVIPDSGITLCLVI